MIWPAVCNAVGESCTKTTIDSTAGRSASRPIRILFKSASHQEALEQLLRGIRRREGFLILTGDIGTGKTTIWHLLIEQLGPKTFTAVVLNPFSSDDELLRAVLQDFGVVSQGKIRHGRLAGASKQQLIDTLNSFLLSFMPLGASAMLVIDEAQNLTPSLLEQIRVLTNLETSQEKLLQVLLVGPYPDLDQACQVEAQLRSRWQFYEARIVASP